MISSRCGRLARTLHTWTKHQHLVGPNDPLSNLRPIIYTDTPSNAGSECKVNHPYSLHEFADVSSSYNYALELQYKLAREQLDALNHDYWAEVRFASREAKPSLTHHPLAQSNARFDAAKTSVLASLPDSAPPDMRENALSEFYKKWVVQERDRQEEYSAQWQKRNFETIVLAARVEYHRLKRRLFG